MLLHGAKVDVQGGGQEHHDQSQDGVEVVGDGLHEQGEAVVAVDDAGNGSGPRGDGHHDAHGRGHGVAHVSQLGAGDLVGVGDGTHDVTNGQVVEVVVNAQHDAQQAGGDQCAGLGLDAAAGPVAIGLGAACADHQSHDGAQNDEEEEDAQVTGHLFVQDAEEVLESADRVTAGVQQSTDNDAEEECGVDLLGDQGQNDGDDRGDQGGPSSVQSRSHKRWFLSFFLFLFLAILNQNKKLFRTFSIS